MADIAKLDAALAYIEEHPKEWAQGSWGHRNACGTAGCIAYHVGRLDGAAIEWDDYSDGLGPYFSVDRIGGEGPATYAQRSLGLSDDQADDLFGGANSMQDLRDMRDALAANPDANLSGLGGSDFPDVDPWDEP
jgi:hypothetical protein